MNIGGMHESMATPKPWTNMVAEPVTPAAVTERVGKQRWEVKKDVNSHIKIPPNCPKTWTPKKGQPSRKYEKSDLAQLNKEIFHENYNDFTAFDNA